VKNQFVVPSSVERSCLQIGEARITALHNGRSSLALTAIGGEKDRALAAPPLSGAAPFSRPTPSRLKPLPIYSSQIWRRDHGALAPRARNCPCKARTAGPNCTFQHRRPSPSPKTTGGLPRRPSPPPRLPAAYPVFSSPHHGLGCRRCLLLRPPPAASAASAAS
jgi:hypothetical protein